MVLLKVEGKPLRGLDQVQFNSGVHFYGISLLCLQKVLEVVAAHIPRSKTKFVLKMSALLAKLHYHGMGRHNITSWHCNVSIP